MVSAYRRAASFRGDALVTHLAAPDRGERLPGPAAARQGARGPAPARRPRGVRRPRCRARSAPATPPDPEARRCWPSGAAPCSRRSPSCRAEQRAALVLVDVQGYPVEEAAAVLECAPGTVKSRCARGRRPAARAARESGDHRNHGAPSRRRPIDDRHGPATGPDRDRRRSPANGKEVPARDRPTTSARGEPAAPPDDPGLRRACVATWLARLLARHRRRPPCPPTWPPGSTRRWPRCGPSGRPTAGPGRRRSDAGRAVGSAAGAGPRAAWSRRPRRSSWSPAAAASPSWPASGSLGPSGSAVGAGAALAPAPAPPSAQQPPEAPQRPGPRPALPELPTALRRRRRPADAPLAADRHLGADGVAPPRRSGGDRPGPRRGPLDRAAGPPPRAPGGSRRP